MVRTSSGFSERFSMSPVRMLIPFRSKCGVVERNAVFDFSMHEEDVYLIFRAKHLELPNWRVGVASR